MSSWRTKLAVSRRTFAYFFALFTFLLFWLLYMDSPVKSSQTALLATGLEYAPSGNIRHLLLDLGGTLSSTPLEGDVSKKKYIVDNSNCKIANLNPFEPEIMPFHKPRKYRDCRDKHLLTRVSKNGTVATLSVDKRYLREYADQVECCYSYVARGKTDLNLIKGPCVDFTDTVVLTQSIVFVKCLDGDGEEVYKNVHASITSHTGIYRKMRQQDEEKTSGERSLSVLFVGIDSVSRMHLYRSLPKTKALLDAGDWIEYRGYNKINDNTFPNLMAILTGLEETRAFKICNPRVVGELDKCRMLWYDYRKLGYITAYAEDETDINTFNFLKKGFVKDPADYYFRPYVLATERYLDGVELHSTKFCTGPETAGERIFNVARDFVTTFFNYTTFGFFWMNSYSHNSVEDVSMMDEKIAEFFQNVGRTGVLENSLVIFISDHGFRFGEITYTFSGWMEERLPFLYIHVPEWFKTRYPKKYASLKINADRLTVPYDLHMTLQEVLILARKNYTVIPSQGCPKCRSLFEQVDVNRSCQDAAITPHWCTCGGHVAMPNNGTVALEIARFLTGEVHRKVLASGGDLELCSTYELYKVISASMSDNINPTGTRDIYYFYVTFKTRPEAVFQGTVSVNVTSPTPTFKLEGDISRLDYYKDKSWCANDATLKKYCYCEGTLKYISSVVRSVKQSLLNIF